MYIRLSAALVVMALTASSATGQSPLGTSFTYQGQLRSAGSPASGMHDLRFQLYNASALGASVGAQLCLDNVPVTGGLFKVELDFGAPFTGQKRFLAIEVRVDTGLNCANPTGFILLNPRQELTATPNALFASNADQLDGVNSTEFLQSIPVPLTLSGTSATHIIRADNASATGGSYGVLGFASAGAGATYGLYGLSASTSGLGVLGLASATSGINSGMSGQSYSTEGRGVFGEATATSGFTRGVYGRSDSTSGRGVYGFAAASTGITDGVYGRSDSTSGEGVVGEVSAPTGVTRGVRGLTLSTSDNAVGVFGSASGASGATHGVFGQSVSSSDNAVGVFGSATAASGVTFGGRFECASPNGIGIFGFATNNSTTGETFGVYGRSDHDQGRGVYGVANRLNGSTYGVYGLSQSPFGYGVFAGGKFGASGTKNFRIDHPDDPENKYLLHYSTESPEVINFYRGTVVLDSAGEAVVELPHYFAKINKTPSYQLTAVGAPMPMLHVAAKISETDLSVGAKAEPSAAAPICSFRIAGGAPGGEVSWRVEAVRNDRWVQQRGAPVEIEKQGNEKGTYQHPELYGQPPEKGMNYRAESARPEPAPQVPVIAALSDATPQR